MLNDAVTTERPIGTSLLVYGDNSHDMLPSHSIWIIVCDNCSSFEVRVVTWHLHGTTIANSCGWKYQDYVYVKGEYQSTMWK